MSVIRTKLIALSLVFLPWLTGLSLADEAQTVPAVAIIIDDLGNELQQGKLAVQLPGSVTLAFLPHAAHTEFLANKANTVGKEVM
ncbi:MAG: divergent polysaccharide deacetylase family protein, partial [Gammaproteobacteria bacterium]